MQKRLLFAVIVIAILASISGIRNGFAHDDFLIILGDPRIRWAGGWQSFFTGSYWPAPFQRDLYRPLTTLVLAFEFLVGGGSPIVFRIVSYALYAGAAASVYRLGLQLFRWEIAAAIAILFAVDPLHAEAVALGVNQNELLIGILSCAMVTLYLQRRRSGAMSRTDWVLLSAMYAGAALLKESGVVAIGLLVIIELFLIRGSIRERVRLLWPGYLSLGAIAVLVLGVRTVVLGSFAGTFQAEALAHAGFGQRALTTLQIIPQWVRLFVWPAHLRADYSPMEFVASKSFGSMEALGAILALLTLIAIWHLRKRSSAVAFGLAWVIVAIAPVSNLLLVSGILIAERTLFLPSVGVALAVGGVLQSALDWDARLVARWRGPLLAVGLVLAALGLTKSWNRQRIWRNDGVLWAASARDAPRSFRVQYALGDVLFDINRPDLGIGAYRKAIAFAPKPCPILNDFARNLRRVGNDSAAAEELRLSLDECTEQPDAEAELIAAEIAMGRYGPASDAARSAARRWNKASVFPGLERVADSARVVGAAPGSIRLRIRSNADGFLGSSVEGP